MGGDLNKADTTNKQPFVSVDITDREIVEKETGRVVINTKTALRYREGKEGYAIHLKGKKAHEIAESITKTIDKIIEESENNHDRK